MFNGASFILAVVLAISGARAMFWEVENATDAAGFSSTTGGLSLYYHSATDITCSGVMVYKAGAADNTSKYLGFSWTGASSYGSSSSSYLLIYARVYSEGSGKLRASVVGNSETWVSNTTLSSTSGYYSWILLGTVNSKITSSTKAWTLRIYMDVAGAYVDQVGCILKGGTAPSGTGSMSTDTSSSICIAPKKLNSYCLEAEWPTGNSGFNLVYDTLASQTFAMMASGDNSNSATAPALSFKITPSRNIIFSPKLLVSSVYIPSGAYVISSGNNALSYTINSDSSIGFSTITFGTMLFPSGAITFKVANYYGGTKIDKIMLGYSIKSTCSATNTRSSSTNCSIFNGYCDPKTTCTQGSGSTTCSACPSWTSGTSKLTTSSSLGCFAKAPDGCYLNMTQVDAAIVPNFALPTSFTVETWFYMTAITTSYFFTYQQNSSYSSTRTLYLMLSKTFQIVTMGQLTDTKITTEYNQWAHLGFSYNGANGAVALYLNGSLVYSGTVSSRSLSTPGYFAVGRDQNISSGYTRGVNFATNFFGGMLDDFRVFNVVRNATDIMKTIAAPIATTTTGLYSYWSFNDFCINNATNPISIARKGTYNITIIPSEHGGLANLYYMTMGASWLFSDPWLLSAPCASGVSSWYGLDCNSNNNVISINLGFNNLVGKITPTFFAGMHYLLYLILPSNSLSGDLTGLGSLTNATHIYLSNNFLSGTIPSLTPLTSIVKLYIENNTLSGSLPTSYPSTLQYLGLHNNSLSGTVPDVLAKSSIQWLDLSRNKLSGSISSSLINTVIPSVDLSNNSFSGILPQRTTANNSIMAKMNFSASYFSCLLPPFLRDTGLAFSFDVTGSLFMCPISSSAAVKGQVCKSVLMNTISPNYTNVKSLTTSSVITIVGSGFQASVCGSYIRVLFGSTIVTPASITDTVIKFLLPSVTAQSVSVKLLWQGSYYNGTQLGSSSLTFTAYKECPNNCSCHSGNCSASASVCHGCCKDKISGVCSCKSGYTGSDCSLMSCPSNCSSHGTCNTKNGTCTCTYPYYGTACNQAYISCPLNCSGHGTCNIYTGACVCYKRYWGLNCSLRACPPYNEPYCTSHGMCNTATGNCSCSSGWIGLACATAAMSCPNNCTNSAQGFCDSTTGTCVCNKIGDLQYGGTDCSKVVCTDDCSGHGTCNTTTGKCICDTNYTSSTCSVKRVLCPNNCTNSTHGTCDTSTGTCSCTSKYKGSSCDQLVCPGTTECMGHGSCNGTTGKCNCYGNSTMWYLGTMCQYKEYSCPNNCSGSHYGSCDSTSGVCYCNSPYYGTSCQYASCTNDCSLQGTCNTTSGVCDCWAGYESMADCSVKTIKCSSSCNENASGGFCDTTVGGCQCYTGWVDGPSGSCTVRSCKNDCSGHGTCNASGTCECETNWRSTDCSVAHFPCPQSCSGAGTCNYTTGECNCNPNRFGDACQYIYCTSLNNCTSESHGTCNTSVGRCICNTADGWLQPNCKRNSCSKHNYCTKSSHGTCNTTTGSCNCIDPYYGDSCQYALCTNNCTGPTHGTCNSTSGACICSSSWQGTDCSTPVRICPLNCSGAGTCNSLTGNCTCNSRHILPNCSLLSCYSANCSGHGTCDYHTGTCKCFANWTGTVCSISNMTCPGSGNCSGHGLCNSVTGACLCKSGWTGSDCATGTCIPACKHGTCNTQNRSCMCTSPYYGTTCSQFTVSCPNDCSNHGKCLTNSTCQCYEPYTGESCAVATCKYDCSGHGTCNTTNGKCICDSNHTGLWCQTGNYECYNNCSGRGTCIKTAGKCSCTSPWQAPYCLTASCSRNCSGSGTCNTTSGMCVCFKNHYGTLCEKKNFSCPSCLNGGSCDTTTGKCVCPYPYYGTICQNRYCVPSCSTVGALNCSLNGTCICKSNYTGTTCTTHKTYECPGNCSGYFCNKLTGTCRCPSSKSGAACNETLCSNSCTNHGTCNLTVGKCICDSGYYGTDCRYLYCPNNCTGSHGTCNALTGLCYCDSAWGGDDCSEPLCVGGCNEGSNGGTCVNGKCVCKASYKGAHCSTPNWTMIILVSVFGSAALIGGAATTFFMIRRHAIKKLENQRRSRMRAAEMATVQ